ncbi:MAG: TlyA family RNA methyltransferase [Desulfovibrionaceae bacterium]|nr:TlyA family RNA methyltransferase [Desulfovibrionaceae bacterium]MBF0513194.1 TlyA family RNA methyltransferase [Desulfovibrionaceae bacterium]
MAKPKVRADELLAERGLAESRERAKRLIMAGMVYAEGAGGRVLVDKPGRMFGPDAALVVAGGERFVSRGGHKLFTAIEKFSLDPRGKVCLDAGAATGGFTDCLLQHGAVRVYAVDVGRAQLHEKLRADPRVVSIEGVNLRLAGPELVPEAVALAVIDVSFISLTLVLPVIARMLVPAGEVVALIKPQFELGPGRADKGVVRDEAARREAVDKIIGFAAGALGFALLGVEPAALKGPKGNQEFVAYFRAPGVRD